MDPRLVGHVLLFAVLWLVLHVAVALQGYPEAFTGAQLDGDGYLRLLRVETLLETGAWYDGTVERSNWPYGVDHHWTRPLDVLILALAAPLMPFLSTGTAVNVAGSLVSPLAHLALGLTLLWAVRPLVPGRERVFVMLVLLTQPVLWSYGLAGRADHHALIFLLAALALGLALRFLADPTRERTALTCGAVLGLGIWVNPEVLLPLLVIFLAGGAAWLLGGQEWARPNRSLALGLVAALTVGLVLERPPPDWGTVSVDRISVAHWTMALIALAYWWAVPRLVAWRRGEGTRGRVGWGAPGAAVAVGLLAAIHPRFFLGPWADTDPRVVEVWLQYVRELQPLVPTAPDELGRGIAALGPALVCVPFAIWKLRRTAPGPVFFQWLALLAALILFVPLAAYQARFGGYIGIVFALVLTAVWSAALPALNRLARPLQQRAARLATMAGLLVGFAAVGAAAELMAQRPGSSAGGEEEDISERCPVTQVVEWLGDPDGWGDRPRVVLAHLDHGPEILYRTPHRVLAGPYHRNRDGILDLHDILATADEEESRRRMRERGVDLILLCPPRDGGFWTRNEDDDLYRRLASGEEPDWLTRRDLPESVAGDFLLYQRR